MACRDGLPSYSNTLLCPHVLLNELHDFGMLPLISDKPPYPRLIKISFLCGPQGIPNFRWDVGGCVHHGLHYTTQQRR